MAVALLLLNGTLLAAIYACAKVAGLGGITPLGVLAWQLPAAAVLVAAFAAATGQWPRPTHANLRYAAVAGTLGIVLPSLVTFGALRHVPAGTIGVIGALSPAITYLLAIARGVERPVARRAAGVALGLAGVLAMVLPRGSLPSGDALPWAIAALAAPTLLAAGNVYRSTAWPPGLPPLGAATLMLALHAALVVPIAIATGQFVVPTDLARPEDAALAGAAVMMGVLYLGAFELQRRAGPVLTGQLGSVIAVASLVIGVVAFGDVYGMPAIIGVLVVFVGVALVTLRPTAAATSRPPVPIAVSPGRTAGRGDRAVGAAQGSAIRAERATSRDEAARC